MTEIPSIFSLKGKTAVVTGASGLIGRAQCRALSDFGAAVSVCDIDMSDTEEILKELNSESFAVCTDVTDIDSLTMAKDIILSKTGSIDILVNNAAVNDIYSGKESVVKQSMFENYSLEFWNKSLEINVTGTFLSCRVFGSVIAQNGGGSIINIASTYGIVGPDQSIYTDETGKQKFYKSPSYPTGKGAILNFTRYLASYWGKNGVRVNTLSPGGVEDGQDSFFIENYSNRTMLGRMAKPSDYAGAVIFLASEASSYMTGANLVVDGGWTAW